MSQLKKIATRAALASAVIIGGAAAANARDTGGATGDVAPSCCSTTPTPPTNTTSVNNQGGSATAISSSGGNIMSVTNKAAAYAPSIGLAAGGCQVGAGASVGVVAVSMGGNLLWMDKQCLATNLASAAFQAAASGNTGFFCVAGRMAAMAMPEYYNGLMDTPEAQSLCVGTFGRAPVVVWKKGAVQGPSHTLR